MYFNEGHKGKYISESTGIPITTVKYWIQDAKGLREETIRPYYRGMKPVGVLRQAAAMLAHGMSRRAVERHTGIDRKTLERQLADPRVVDAMYEFDPHVTYDYNSMTDRSIVAHHLCRQTFDVVDRADLLIAVIFPKERHEAKSEAPVGCGSPQRQVQAGPAVSGNRAIPHHGRRP